MLCSRCGDAAVVQRGSVYYCGRCALTRDWEEIVRIIQGLEPHSAAATASGDPAAPVDPFAA